MSDVSVETGVKRVFATAMEWPGWSRSGKDQALAIKALKGYAERYARVAKEAGVPFPDDTADRLEVTEVVSGSAGTEFGVPGQVTDLDRVPLTRAKAERLASLVAAAWTVFDQVAASAPASLRKGPRGGGRDRDKVVGHVVESDRAYAREMGIKIAPLDPADREAVETMRIELLKVLRRASDGSPLADGKWPPRYAARRIAWHTLDHAWEIEDRS